MTHERLVGPVATIELAIPLTSDLAHVVLIDLVVGARFETHHDVVTRLRDAIASLAASSAHGRRAVELPRAGAVQEVLREQRTDRAEIHYVARPRIREIVSLGFADEGAIAALGHIEHRLVGHIRHEADAARAQDAAVRHIEHVTAEVFDRIEALRLPVAGVCASFSEGVVLKFALTRLIADRAVEWMIDQQELEHTLPRLERFG